MPSSVISCYHYYPDTMILRVIFISGLVYDYQNVPQEVYNKMKATVSKGIYLNKHIKGKFAFVKVDG